METVMNNSMWESWEVFIQDSGTEEQEWNNNLI
jgi:1,2-phenylacetyl-CoA epoxidase PaaB subunit